MARLAPLVARRAAHEPLALILGRREFWSLEFAVSPATLIPRPESETLIEAAVAAFADREPPRLVLDLGTGTGCLLLAALSEFPAALGIGVDRSAEAAALAARNAAALHLADRALFVCGDWADAAGRPVRSRPGQPALYPHRGPRRPDARGGALRAAHRPGRRRRTGSRPIAGCFRRFPGC